MNNYAVQSRYWILALQGVYICIYWYELMIYLYFGLILTDGAVYVDR